MKDKRRRYQQYKRGSGAGQNRKFLTRMAVSLMLLTVAGGVGLLGYSVLQKTDFFQVSSIEIQGCQRMSKEEVLELSGVDVHSNLVAVSRNRVRNRLEAHDWVERARVSIGWPDRLTIEIKERCPVAMVNLAGELHYVDREGTVFSRAGADDLDYPVISGFHGGAGEPQPDPALLEALLFLKYGGRDNPNLPVQNISEISIRDDDIVVFLMDNPFPIHLGRGSIWEKYNRLAKVLSWLYRRKEFDETSYIYVDYSPDKVLVGRKTG